MNIQNALAAIRSMNDESREVAENLKKFETEPSNLCIADCCRTCTHRVLLDWTMYDVFCAKHKRTIECHMKCDAFNKLSKGSENVEFTQESMEIIKELQEHNAW